MDAYFGYAYCHATDWKIDHFDTKLGTTTLFLAPENASESAFPSNIQMVAERTSSSSTVEAYRDHSVEHFRSLHPDAKVSNPERKLYAAGEAWEVHITWTSNGFELDMDSTIFLHGGIGYIFSYSAEADYAYEFQDEAAADVASIRFS